MGCTTSVIAKLYAIRDGFLLAKKLKLKAIDIDVYAKAVLGRIGIHFSANRLLHSLVVIVRTSWAPFLRLRSSIFTGKLIEVQLHYKDKE